MATFEEQVEALTGIAITGSSDPTQTELSAFLVDGVIDVVNRMIEARPAELSKFTKTTNSTTTVTKTGKALSVVREHDSTSILRKCTAIDPGDRYEATDVDSLLYRSKTSPGYYELDGLIHAVPTAGSGNNDIVVTQVYYDVGLVFGDNYNNATPQIENFPSDYEYLVAIYAAIQSLQAAMGDMSGSFNTAITTTALGAVATEIGLAKVEVAEMVSQTDNSGEIETALDAIKTELDKVDNVIVEGSTEIDKSTALLDLGETDSEGAVNTAAGKIITEMDETQSVCDKIDADLVLAKAEIVLAKQEAAEIASNTDNSSDFETACDAMVTELAKVDNIIVEASDIFDTVDEVIAFGSTEFDEAKNLSKAFNSGEVYDALGAIKTNVDLANTIVDSPPVPPDVPTLSVQSVSITGTAPTYTAPSITSTAGSPDDLSDMIDSDWTELDFDFDDENIDFATWFQVVGDYIQKQEDSELASAQIQKITTYLSAYSQSMQNRINVFNDANVEYQALLQKDIKNAELSDANEARELQKYSAEIAEYQAELGEMNQRIQGYLSTAQGYSNEVQAYTTVGQTFINTGNAYLAEANAIVGQGNAYLQEAQASIAQSNGYAAEVSARSTFVGAKSQAVQGHISTAQSYVASAQGFASEVQAKIAIANGYIAEINIRLAQAGAKREESKSRLTAGSAYLQEAQAYIAQANGYAAEVNARTGFTSAKMQAVQGYINTASTYAAEATARLQVDVTKYQWFQEQSVRLRAQYDAAFVVPGGGE